jgi:hypothetical protein
MPNGQPKLSAFRRLDIRGRGPISSLLLLPQAGHLPGIALLIRDDWAVKQILYQVKRKDSIRDESVQSYVSWVLTTYASCTIVIGCCTSPKAPITHQESNLEAHQQPLPLRCQ